MDITQVKVFPVHEEKLKAFVSIVLDHCFMINDIKVIQGKDGLFLSMPSRRKKSGEFKDVAHPLNNGTRRMLEERVLSEYRQLVDDLTPRRPDRCDDDVDRASDVHPEPPPPAAARPSEQPDLWPVTPPAAPPMPPQPAAVAIAAAGDAPRATNENEADDSAVDQSLEEVQELHLRDSFWTVT